MEQILKSSDSNYKTTLFPLDTMSIIGIGLLVATVVICTMAGTGGNSQLFTVILVFMAFHPTNAVAQTSLCGFISSLTRLLYEIYGGYKDDKAKKINYHIVLLASPGIVSGVFFGVILNQITPEAITFIGIMILFTILTFLSCYKFIKTLKKVISERKKTKPKFKRNLNTTMLTVNLSDTQSILNESLTPFSPVIQIQSSNQNEGEKMNDSQGGKRGSVASEEIFYYEQKLEKPLSEDNDDNMTRNGSMSGNEGNQKLPKILTVSQSDFYQDTAQSIVSNRARILTNTRIFTQPLKLGDPSIIQMSMTKTDILILLVYCAFCPAMAILRGTPTLHSVIGNQECTLQDLYLMVFSFSLLAVVAFYSTSKIFMIGKSVFQTNRQIRLPFMKIMYILVSNFLIGVIGGALGVAISSMSNLLLVFMGLSPFVAGPTALAINFLVTGSSSFLFFVSGKVDIPTFLIAGAIVLVFSLLTRLTIYKLMVKSGLTFLPVFLVLILTVISGPGIVYKMAPEIYEQNQAGVDIFKFRNPCSLNQ